MSAGKPSTAAVRAIEAVAILDALRAFTAAMDRYIDGHGGAQGLHRTDLIALAHVMDANRRGEDLTPGALSAALNLSPPATSALLTRLEAVGHVRRTHDAVDRRRVSIAMTGQAQDAGRAVFEPIGSALTALVDRYSAHDRAVVLRFLTEAVEATNRAVDAPAAEAGLGSTT